ncbi:MAG: DUF58 domain-containing protein [Acidimicrobiales bacterium]|nr:DUF58 domain-containing protein [Acidimicrobiales bacterium]
MSVMTAALPTRRAGLVAAGLGVVAAFGLGSLPTLVVLQAVLAVLLVVDGLLAVSPKRLECTRILPPSVSLDQPVRLAWQIRNPTNRSVRCRLADELPPSWRCTDRRSAMKIPAPSTVTRPRRFRPARRGRFTSSEVVGRTTGPMGLTARQATRQVPGALRVIPAFPSRAEAELRMDRSRLIEIGLRTTKGRGGGTDFDQLREYQVDDEYRRIDWTATARRGSPVVRTYRAERNQQVLVLLDTGRTMAPVVQGAARLEHALDAVMALAVAAGRLGDRVSFLAHDVQPRAKVPPLDRPDRAPLLVDAMVDLQPRLVETDYLRAALQLDAQYRRRSLVVVLTDLAEAVTVEQLTPALRLLLRRHLVLVAAAADPTLHRWADEPADDLEAVYRKAAATRQLERRAEIAAELRRQGAVVLDEEPKRLALRVVDTYLAIKTDQRL